MAEITQVPQRKDGQAASAQAPVFLPRVDICDTGSELLMFADAAKAGYIELVPIVSGWRAKSGKSGQQRATGVRTRAPDGAAPSDRRNPVGQRDFIRAYVAGQARGTGLEYKSRR